LLRHQEIKERLQKIGAGLEKMEEALQRVSEMKNELAEKEKVLDDETAKTGDALKMVSFYTCLFVVAIRGILSFEFHFTPPFSFFADYSITNFFVPSAAFTDRQILSRVFISIVVEFLDVDVRRSDICRLRPLCPTLPLFITV